MTNIKGKGNAYLPPYIQTLQKGIWKPRGWGIGF